MQRYLCPKCKGVFCGWAVIYKLKYKCPNCGGRLKKINPDKQKFRKGLIDKALKTRKNLKSGNL